MAAKRPPASPPRSRSQERSRREIRSSSGGPHRPNGGVGLLRRRWALGTVVALLLALVGWGARHFYLNRRPKEVPAAESIEPAERALREAARQHPRDAA